MGEDSVVANFNQSLRENVMKESANELGSLKGCLFRSSTFGSIAIGEGDRSLFRIDVQDSLLIDRNSVNVSSQIQQESPRIVPGWLDIDSPGLCLRLQNLSGVSRRHGGFSFNEIKQLCFENFSECFDREKEFRMGRDPTISDRVEPTRCDDTVYMRVVVELLSPGVENGDHA